VDATIDDPFEDLRRGLRGEGAEGAVRGIGRRELLVGGGLALLLALAILVTSTLQPTPDESIEAPRLADLEPAAPPTPEASTTVSESARVWPAEPVEIAGTEVRTGSHRWSVGEAGDVVAVGDWNCDGMATPALVRPSSGRLYVFDSWATEDAPATASPGPTVPVGVTAVSADGCGRAMVRTADGRTHLVATDGEAP
jgi:hypothetical protein